MGKSGDATGKLPPSTCKQDSPTNVTCTGPAAGVSGVVFQTYPSLKALHAAYTAKVTSLNSNQFRQNFNDYGAQGTYGEVGWNHLFQHIKAHEGWPRGATSDDTALTLLTAHHLADRDGDGDPAAFLADLAEHGAAIRGLGPTTTAAIERFRRGDESVGSPGTATNGAAMRTLPVMDWIQVRDVHAGHAGHARLAAAGVPVARELVAEPWDLIEMRFEDRDGLRIARAEVPAGHPSPP